MTVSPRRLGKHVSETVDYLGAIGACDVEIVCSRHIRLAFTYGARQDVRRAIRNAGVRG